MAENASARRPSLVEEPALNSVRQYRTNCHTETSYHTKSGYTVSVSIQSGAAHARTDAERYGSDAAALGLVRIIGLITAGS
jgi:hypothetical protein